jgi:hypothetical protein
MDEPHAFRKTTTEMVCGILSVGVGIDARSIRDGNCPGAGAYKGVHIEKKS